jgi:nitrate/nitrite transporter NarK
MQRLVVAVIVCVLVAVFAGWLWAVRAALLLVALWLLLRLAAQVQRGVKKNIKRRLQA